MNSIMGRAIEHLDLSHNAFGPDGVKSFQDFLSKCPTLRILNVTNCGLGPKGGQMIAEAIEKNPHMKLREFYASRDRLEQEGLEALSKVFSKQQCLEKIEVYQNGSKEGLKFLLSSFVHCRATLKSVNI
jgi:Ran GTPase-activating protein 1